MADETHRLGEFRLTHRLGEGGMAEVWAATHVTFGGEAALKVMLPGAKSDIVRDAFVAEARSHAGLEHRHIVRLLDYGRVDERDAPPPGVRPADAYLVMERADATVRDDRLPSSWSQLFPILRDVLSGLAYSHARGFVHRDLKPENVLKFGGSTPTYKLADFGIAQSVNLDETADRNTLSLAMGTPHYMAPEQFKGHWYEFGPATDLYALGCVVFELCTGHVPYPQTALMALATAHIGAPIPTLRSRFEVPSGLGEWVARLLQKRPRDRFRFAADAAHALFDLSRGFESGDVADEAHSEPVPLDEAATLVESVTDMMFGETLDVGELDFADTKIPTMPSMPALAAPLDEHWQAEQEKIETPALGLGLFALRETPIAGFDEVRDELWEVLKDVVHRGRPRVVVLRGTATSPIDALGTWLYQRAGEVGAAVTHDVFYTRAGGPREGLVALLEDAFSTWGMHDDEARQRIGTFVDEFVDEAVAPSCREIATDLVMTARGVEARHLRAPSRGERYRVVAQVLSSAAGERPHLAWIAGAHWGGDAMGFAEQTLEGGAASFVVLGVVDDELQPQTRQRFDELVSRPGVRVIDVREPTADERLQLAQRMLPLDSDTADELVSIARGDEVALRLLIDAFRRRDGLAATSEGYQLAPGVSLPSGRAQVFELAVSSLVALNPQLGDALELAAVLGRAPDVVELNDVLAGSGTLPRVLQETLEEHGLARSVGSRWWFVHDGVVEVLQQTARAGGRWAQHNTKCADVLLKRAVLDVPHLLLRAAQHLIAAGEPARSLSPTFRAMRALIREDVSRVRTLHASYEELCDELGLSEAHSARLDGAIIEMALLRVGGEIDASRARATNAIGAARQVGHRVAEAIALRHLARLDMFEQSYETAADLLLQAETIAGDAGERTEQAAAARLLGQVHDRMGDFEAAITAMTRAAGLYGQAGDVAAEGRTLTNLAAVLSHAGRREQARDCAERALRLARSAGGEGAAEASNALGDLARIAGDLTEARDRYQEALARSAFRASFNRHILELNLAMVDLAEGNIDAAGRTFTRLRGKFEEVRMQLLMTIATAGMASCAAMRGDVGEALELLGEVEDGMGETADADVIAILEVAYERGDPSTHDAVSRLLEEQRRRLLS